MSAESNKPGLWDRITGSDALQTKLNREVEKRKAAETLLEQKSLEVYNAMQAVEAQKKELEATNKKVEAANLELSEAFLQLQAQEEELRQNAEELRTVNDHMMTIQRELQISLDDLKNSQMQVQMAQREKMAALGQLVAGVAHEINTPVGVSVTAASHLFQIAQEFKTKFEAGQMKKSDLTEFIDDAAENSDIILVNLDRAAKLIKSFKKVSADQATETKQTINFKEYVGEILHSLYPTLKKTHITHRLVMTDDIILYTYPSALAQIIINFVTNAVRYAYDDGETGILTLKAEAQGESLHFSFADDGKGIGPEHLAKVFDPFYTTGRNIGGTGLGLNIVYNIVTKQLKGDIRLESLVGQGTTFYINIPMNLSD